jgi:hypothetical protein
MIMHRDYILLESESIDPITEFRWKLEEEGVVLVVLGAGRESVFLTCHQAGK